MRSISPAGKPCDVLVIGAGLAGIQAALSAAESGRSVILAAQGSIGSGSSFFKGTWGLGLIAPKDDADASDLADTIQRVGCGMADPSLVDAFVEGIRPAIDRLAAQGVRLRRPAQDFQREFIPCFDHALRQWYGIERPLAHSALSSRLADAGVRLLPRTQAIDLVKADGCVVGAVVERNAGGADSRLEFMAARSVVLATGGFGGLYRDHLCPADVMGTGQALALRAGAGLVNMEFMQIMPGLVSPKRGIVFNEKAFRFSRFTHPDGADALASISNSQEVLNLRATHGPFTTRLESKAFDIALAAFQAGGGAGFDVVYDRSMIDDPPEFVRVYFDWLKSACGLTARDPMRIGLYAHAANGGIRIDSEASTGVPGLFAAGEVTGGMHGADRIGGLSSANCLVFGGIAGASAAAFADQAPSGAVEGMAAESIHPDPASALRVLRDVMTRYAMVERCAEGLGRASQRIAEIASSFEEDPNASDGQVALSRMLESQLQTAQAMVTAAAHRSESRGPQYRSDAPETDPAQARPFVMRGPLRTSP